MPEAESNNLVTTNGSEPSTVEEDVEGLETESVGDYPLKEIMIRDEKRTVQGVIQRIRQETYIMNPDFQRDFIWPDRKQSKLIESVIMRIPLPVFYLAEDTAGRIIVVDGLQRLSTFERFLDDKLRLDLPDREELHRKRFSELPPMLRNRVEDCNLTVYLLASTVPERARLDIFERVNGGVPLTRQQMRNCLFMGQATRFLKVETQTDIFFEATGGSLNSKTMRDREFVNRYCAFQILDYTEYRGDMDDFLAKCLTKMNHSSSSEINRLSDQFRRGLSNNFLVFGEHAFRKHSTRQTRRSVLNASLWDVMSTGLSHYPEPHIKSCKRHLKRAALALLQDDDFDDAISRSTNDTKRVEMRFDMSRRKIEEILGAP